MKLLKTILLVVLQAPVIAAAAAVEPVQPASWHATSLGEAIGYMLLFAFIGIGAAVAGFKIFDKCTPGDLSREIIENKNIAAAIVAAAVILGVCLIVAVAMIS